MTDAEFRKLSLKRFRFLNNLIHPGPGRANPAPVYQCPYIPFFTFEASFNVTVCQVSHPTSDIMLQGLLHSKITVVNSLHYSFYGYSGPQSHGRVPPPFPEL